MSRWFGVLVLLRFFVLGLTMSGWLGMVVMLGFTVVFAAMSFVHAFVQPLSGLPGVLVTGSVGEDKTSEGENGEGGFHGRGDEKTCLHPRGTWRGCNQVLVFALFSVAGLPVG